MDWLSRIFDIHKLPFKIILLFAFISGIIVFNPWGILSYLRLDSISKEWEMYFGIIFLVFGSLSIINIFIQIWYAAYLLYSRQTLSKLKIQRINRLDYAEQAVLREFFLQNVHSIKLPIDNPTVALLMNQDIIRLAGQFGQLEYSGQVFPVCLDEFIREYIENNPNVIRISKNESIEWLKDNRPSFMQNMSRYDF